MVISGLSGFQSKWFEATVISEKTKCMIISTQSYRGDTNLVLQMHNEVLEQVPVFKYLGVFIDNRLNFNAHVDHARKKSKISLEAIGWVRRFITKDIALN